ncbi:glycoside hydrolase family 5 protein [Chlorogloeopsis sp. ULAP02]|uniref:glycoside hydrolase family 5 protein n=1 Tax=Chlorogloeopsis sp. ULAP02 TaxID=3107926 RepID=UPI0031349F8C
MIEFAQKQDNLYATLLQYKRLGLTYTRLPIVLSNFFNDKNPNVLKQDYLAALDTIVQMHMRIGLGITICPFDAPEELYSNPAAVTKYLAFFKAFATHFNHTNPEKVFLEVLNEPSAETPHVWNQIQPRLISTIRSYAPNHTIIASSNLRVTKSHWNNLRALLKTEIVKDRNVVYNFHFYDPFVFTHQGATWGWEALKYMKGVPYPSNPQAVAPLLNKIRDPQARWGVENYGKEQWNKFKLVNELSLVAKWAKSNGVPVICNEFGVIQSANVPRDSMLRYLKDVRQILESYNIGWNQWFRLNLRDQEIMHALGLKPLIRS